MCEANSSATSKYGMSQMISHLYLGAMVQEIRCNEKKTSQTTTGTGRKEACRSNCWLCDTLDRDIFNVTAVWNLFLMHSEFPRNLRLQARLRTLIGVRSPGEPCPESGNRNIVMLLLFTT